MIKLKCKCGKSEIEFKHLSAKDFPKGLECDSCKDFEVKIEESAEKEKEESKPKKKRGRAKKRAKSEGSSNI